MVNKIVQFTNEHLYCVKKMLRDYERDRPDHVKSDQDDDQEAMLGLIMCRRDWRSAHSKLQWAELMKLSPTDMGNKFINPFTDGDFDRANAPSNRALLLDVLILRRKWRQSLSPEEKLLDSYDFIEEPVHQELDFSRWDGGVMPSWAAGSATIGFAK